MPNWAMNEFYVQAPNKSSLDDFIKKMRGACGEDEVISFQSIRPMPEILEDTVSPPTKIQTVLNAIEEFAGKDIDIENFEQSYRLNTKNKNVYDLIKSYRHNQLALQETGYSNWYEWQHDKWGVKWGCSESTISIENDTNCLYCFQTPWGSPINWLKYLANLYPDFNFLLKCADPAMDFHHEYSFENGVMTEEVELNFREAVEIGNWGGMEDWAEMFDEEEVE